MTSLNSDDALWMNLDAEKLQNREEYSMLCCFQVGSCCWKLGCCWQI